METKIKISAIWLAELHGGARQQPRGAKQPRRGERVEGHRARQRRVRDPKPRLQRNGHVAAARSLGALLIVFGCVYASLVALDVEPQPSPLATRPHSRGEGGGPRERRGAPARLGLWADSRGGGIGNNWGGE